jgi:hypothetical protein
MHRFRSGIARTSASISALSTPSVTKKGISPSEGRHQEGFARGIGSNAPRLVAGEELGRRAPPRLVLEIDVGERLPVVVADDEAGVRPLGGPVGPRRGLISLE